MSLIKNKPLCTAERSPLRTEIEFKHEQLEKGKQYQKDNRKSHLAIYKEQKLIIDKLDQVGLHKYVDSTLKYAHDTRVGNLNVKINAHELARIKLAILQLGSRSARDLLFGLVEDRWD